jgi:hypothetical protein
MTKISNRFVALTSCAVLSAGLIATDAMAAAPRLNGTYAVTGTVFCQPGTTGAAAGAYDVNIGTATFFPSDGVVTLQQTQVLGSVTNTSMPFALRNKNYSFTYTKTASSITMNNIAFKAVYSNIQGGTAQSVTGVGVDSAGCARSFTMQIITTDDH